MVSEETLKEEAPEPIKFLYKKHYDFVEKLGFGVEKYEHNSEFGGSSLLIFRKKHFLIMVTKSRDGIAYNFGDIKCLKAYDWYSFDIIRHFVDNMTNYRKLQQVNPIKYILANIDFLEQSFLEEKRKVTVEALRQLEKKRAKKLFG